MFVVVRNHPSEGHLFYAESVERAIEWIERHYPKGTYYLDVYHFDAGIIDDTVGSGGCMEYESKNDNPQRQGGV